MQGTYRAVPNEDTMAIAALTIQARSDLDALVQAKQKLGVYTAFILWEGERKALAYTPLADLLRAKLKGDTQE